MEEEPNPVDATNNEMHQEAVQDQKKYEEDSEHDETLVEYEAPWIQKVLEKFDKRWMRRWKQTNLLIQDQVKDTRQQIPSAAAATKQEMAEMKRQQNGEIEKQKENNRDTHQIVEKIAAQKVQIIAKQNEHQQEIQEVKNSVIKEIEAKLAYSMENFATDNPTPPQ